MLYIYIYFIIYLLPYTFKIYAYFLFMIFMVYCIYYYIYHIIYIMCMKYIILLCYIYDTGSALIAGGRHGRACGEGSSEVCV